MKRRKGFRGICRTAFSLILVVAMVLQVPQFSYESQAAVTPSNVNEAVGKFTDSMSKFCADTSKMTGFQSFLTRLGGVSAGVNGVIGILQMAGIIKDPMKVNIGKILDEVHSIQTQLNQMDVKIDNINHQLIDIASVQVEKDRTSKATAMLGYWRDFKRDYMEPLDDMINEYEGLVNSGIRSWWRTSSHEGVRVNYTIVDGNVPNLTYKYGSYSEGLPAEADNGEEVAADYSFGVPADIIPNTSSIKFNIDTYRTIFEEKMADNFIKAMETPGKIDCNLVFYAAWYQMPENERKEKAKEYATDILNTIIYQISCDVMSENDSWVISVRNAYRKYCDNVMTKDSGINAMLNAMYLTHGFEGEIKDDIMDFCDAMIVKTGFYGEFVLTCVGQDDMQSLENRQMVQELFTDTILNISEKKKYAITGHDNFCYVTGTLVDFSKASASSKVSLDVGLSTTSRGFVQSSFRKASADSWTSQVPNMMDTVNMQVLFRQYRTLSQGEKTFSDYLGKYVPSFSSSSFGDNVLVTKYSGPRSFALNEGIWLMANRCWGDYFASGITYRVNVGNPSKIEDKYFLVHDKVLCDTFNPKTGAVQVDANVGARAVYGESHTLWQTDEVHVLFSGNNEFSSSTRKTHDNKTWYGDYTFKINYYVLELSQCKDLNGEEDEIDPFLAYGGYILNNEKANLIGPDQVVVGTPITDVKLDQETFTCTGKAIEPAVTVLSENGSVLQDGYDVTYINNTDIGYATVIVNGKGDYRGTVIKQFEIVSAEKDKKPTKVAGVGTISADGKTLTDTYKVKYNVSEKLKSSDLKMNLKVADEKSNGKYKITKITKKNGKITGGTVTYIKPYNKNCTSASISPTVKIGGVKFKVTVVTNNAFKNCKKLSKVTIGKNVTLIGKNAFSGCSSLSTITINATNLKKIGAGAFKGIKAEAKFKVPKKKITKYEKMIRKAGAPKKSKVN